MSIPWDSRYRRAFVHSTRTAIAAVLSLLAARILHMPEDYWAAITTLIVMQSRLGAALKYLRTTTRRNGTGRCHRSVAHDLRGVKRLGFRSGRVYPRHGLRRLAPGRCVSFRRSRSGYCYACGSSTVALDHRAPSFCRSGCRYRCGANDDCIMARKRLARVKRGGCPRWRGPVWLVWDDSHVKILSACFSHTEFG